MNKYILFLTVLSIIMTACNDDFMDKLPQSEITAEKFFNTPEDLNTYINGLYNESLLYIRNNCDNEAFSDNIAYR